MPTRHYRGRLGRKRRPGESRAVLRPLAKAALGLPPDVDLETYTRALEDRHIPYATEVKPKAAKPAGRLPSIDPFVTESLVLFINQEMAEQPRPLLTICKKLADDFDMKPRTMARIYQILSA